MTLTAMLLVGGESRRMGTDKATLVVAGEPLWQRQLRLLRELDPEAIWISARSRPAWCPKDIELVLDEPPSRGPLSGLAAALSRLQTSHLLALAIDMPQMTALHVKKLLALVQPGRGVVPLNVRPQPLVGPPRRGGRGTALSAKAPYQTEGLPLNGNFFEPLCAIYPAAAAPLACRELRQNHLSLQHLVELLSQKEFITCYSVTEHEKYLYHNANSPSTDAR